MPPVEPALADAEDTLLTDLVGADEVICLLGADAVVGVILDFCADIFAAGDVAVVALALIPLDTAVLSDDLAFVRLDLVADILFVGAVLVNCFFVLLTPEDTGLEVISDALALARLAADLFATPLDIADFSDDLAFIMLAADFLCADVLAIFFSVNDLLAFFFSVNDLLAFFVAIIFTSLILRLLPLRVTLLLLRLPLPLPPQGQADSLHQPSSDSAILRHP